MILSICFANCWFCQLPKTGSNIYAIKQQSVNMFSTSFTNCWFCQLPEWRNNNYVIKHQFRHIFWGKKIKTEISDSVFQKIYIAYLWFCDFTTRVYPSMKGLCRKLFHRSNFKRKKKLLIQVTKTGKYSFLNLGDHSKYMYVQNRWSANRKGNSSFIEIGCPPKKLQVKGI